MKILFMQAKIKKRELKLNYNNKKKFRNNNRCRYVRYNCYSKLVYE